jgi:hypothetical protein
MGKKESLYTDGGNANLYNHSGKFWKLLKYLNIDLTYDPAIPLLGIYSKERGTSYSRGSCTPMFIVALFTIAKLWKQPRCPNTEEWIKKMWYLYTTEFYAAMKKNEILLFGSKRMELENIILMRLGRHRRPKIVGSSSYMDFRSRVNTTRGLEFDHMIRPEHTREV